jgi:putative acetyltransferase
MIIRKEKRSDIEAITQVTISAFQTLPISNHTEQFIIKALRTAGALTLSLVAEIEGRVVGHVAFSPVIMSDGTKDWYGLGPVSVLPEYQKQGIGKSLINEGLSLLKQLGDKAVFLLVIQTIINDSVSRIFQNWFIREFHKKFSLPYHSMKRFPKELLCFMKGSWQMANNRINSEWQFRCAPLPAG